MSTVGAGLFAPGFTDNDLQPPALDVTRWVWLREGTAWLEAGGITVKPGLMRRLGVGSAHGALVQFVTPGSAAARAGIRGGSRVQRVGGKQQVVGGDVIVGVDGTAVRTFSDVRRAVGHASPGSILVLELVRERATLIVPVRLAHSPWRS